MIIARIIRKWFRPQDDFAALGEQLRRLHAGEITRLELPPGISFQLLLPECPKCGYRAEGGANHSEGNTEEGRAVRVAGDLAASDIGVARDDLGAKRVIPPLADAEDAQARRCGHSVLPTSGEECGSASKADRRHGVPPLHVFIDRIHRRILGGKPSLPQGERA